MAAEMFYLPFPTAFTSNGLPAAGAKLYFYYSGTSTPAPSFANAGLTVAHPHPVVANGAGRYPNIYLDSGTVLRLVIKDKAGITLQDTDPYIPGEINPGDISFDSVVGLATVGNRTLLASLPTSSGAAILTEAGHEGLFVWSGTSLVAQVAADPNKLFYVALAAVPNGAGGAWVRRGYSSAPTRATLAVIPSTQGTVHLREAGREGVFIWNSANLSAEVAADPYQGLYVPPAQATSGASGAWVRAVPDRAYLLDWWNPTQLGVNGHTVLNTIDSVIEDGSTLLWGANTVTVSDNVVFLKSVHIEGINPEVSRLEVDAGATSAIGSVGVLFLRKSHSSVKRMGVRGLETGLFSNNPACIQVQSPYDTANPASLADRVVEDVEISGCVLENTSLGIVVSTSADTNGSSNGGQIVVPAKNIRTHHNTITTNMHGITYFGCDNSVIHDNTILPSPNTPAAQFSAAIRILGSQWVQAHNNILRGLGDDRSDRCAVRLDPANYTTGARRANANVSIRGNDASGFSKFAWIAECAERCDIADNMWFEDRASTNYEIWAVFVTAGAIFDGLLPVISRLFVQNNRFEGVSRYLQTTSAGGTSEMIHSSNNRVVGNAAVNNVAGRIVDAQYPPAVFTELVGDTFLMSDTGGSDCRFQNSAGRYMRVVGCTLPAAASGDPTMQDFSGGGTFTTTMGNTGESVVLGSNVRYPAGLFAAATA